MSGGQLLIVDPSESDRDALRAFFEARGYAVAAVATPAQARARVRDKYFVAALVDLDAGGPGEGVALLRELRASSAATQAVLLCAAPSYEGAVAAMRAGALDVVQKGPRERAHLGAVVDRASAASGDPPLLEEVRGVLDESFKVMLGLSRKVYAHLSLANAPLRPSILVVDGDGDFLRELAGTLGDRGWAVAAEMTGGAALDKGSTEALHVVACRDALMDLPGSMVLRTLQAQRPEVLGLLYGAGGVRRVERGEPVGDARAFGEAADLTRALDEVVEDLGARAEERRFIQAFSGDHRAFLRRYADLKLAIDRLLSG